MSDCGVCIGSYPDGYCEFFKDDYRVARKPHRCGECGRSIAPGQRYHDARGKFEGDFWTMKSCLDCAEIRAAFSCEGESFGTLWEAMSDYAFENLNESCFQKLSTVSAKKYLRERWMKWKGLPTQ